MSKSLGNFFTIREILGEFDAVALRHFFLGSHYRNPLDFSKDGLEEAGKAADRIFETIERLGKAVKTGAQATARWRSDGRVSPGNGRRFQYAAGAGADLRRGARAQQTAR